MISFFRAPIRNIAPQAQVTVQQIYKYITSDYAKLVTERLRSIADHGEARKFKAETFDYVTFSGCFSSRRTGGLIEHSGFLCFDIDKIESERRLQEIKSLLINDEELHTVLCFRSPSGNGLKWVVEVPDRVWLGVSHTEDISHTERTENTEMTLRVPSGFDLSPTDDTDDSDFNSSLSSIRSLAAQEVARRIGTDLTPSVFDHSPYKQGESCRDVIVKNHRVLYERIRGYLFERYGIETDHTSDIARPCYLPHDDDAFYDEPTFHANPAHPFLADARSTVDSQQSTALTDTACRVPTKGDSKRGLYDDTEAVVREIEKRRIDITGDYLNWIRIAFALASKHGVTGEEYFHRISQFHPSYDPKEAHKVYTSCLRNNSGAVTIGTIVYLMRS